MGSVTTAISNMNRLTGSDPHQSSLKSLETHEIQLLWESAKPQISAMTSHLCSLREEFQKYENNILIKSHQNFTQHS